LIYHLFQLNNFVEYRLRYWIVTWSARYLSTAFLRWYIFCIANFNVIVILSLMCMLLMSLKIEMFA